MREAALPDDWFSSDMAEASSDFAMQFPAHTAPSYAPLEPSDAARLRAKMANRYREWTGRDLAADLALAEQEKGRG